MIIFDLMLVVLIIITIALLSGVKIMFKPRYVQSISIIFLMYTQLSNLIEGYKLGYIEITSIIAISIVFLLIFIWGHRINKHIYSIHNVKENDVINIIEKYLERKNIRYEIINEEIYLPDIDNNIYVRSLMETTLDFRKIKNSYFYNELVDEVKAGIKEIKQRYFPIEGAFYLILTLFCIWIRVIFSNILNVL